MRKLLVGAVLAAAFAVPSGAEAQTAPSGACTDAPVECAITTVRYLTDCPLDGCHPDVDPHTVCYLIFGEPCTRREE